MILDRLEEADRYAPIHRDFARAFEFLRRPGLASLPDGRVEIDGDRLFAIVQRAPGRRRDTTRLETHRHTIDIQFILSGGEEVGWMKASGLEDSDGGYQADRDIEFWRERAQVWIRLDPGSFGLFFPDDGHAPLVSSAEIVHKVVVKVRVP